MYVCMEGVCLSKTKNSLLVHVIMNLLTFLLKCGPEGSPVERKEDNKANYHLCEAKQLGSSALQTQPMRSRVQSKQLQAKAEGAGFALTKETQRVFFSSCSVCLFISTALHAINSLTPNLECQIAKTHVHHVVGFLAK